MALAAPMEATLKGGAFLCDPLPCWEATVSALPLGLRECAPRLPIET